jgi:hypothetical protein
MRIEDIRRWQWLIIGVLLGLFVCWWRGSAGAEQALAGRSTLDTGEFEQMLHRPGRDGAPRIRNIRAYPVGDGVIWLGAEYNERRGGRWWGRRRGGRDGDGGEERWIPVKIRTVTPFVPRINPPANTDPNYTVIDYLAELEAKNPNVGFAANWWDAEPARSITWAAGGALIVGGIWPTIINLLIGAGYGHRSQKKEPDYDLSRFGNGGPEAAAPVKAEPSEA